MARYLGCDPGLVGGLAVIETCAPFDVAELVDAIDIPVSALGAKRRINVNVVLNWIRRHDPHHAFMERAGLFPGQNVAAGAIYMRAAGMLEATIMLAGVQMTMIEASVWKRKLKLPGVTMAGSASASKEAARQKAIEVFGASDLLALKSHHGRAEAALMALYGADHGLEVEPSPEPELPLRPRRPSMAV